MVVSILLLAASVPQVSDTGRVAFTHQRVMIPVRDGVKLETVIMRPTASSAPLPILFRRTPYGVPANANVMNSAALKDFVKDGYIFVVQNLRGRFGSEGTFELTSKADLKNPKATSETTSVNMRMACSRARGMSSARTKPIAGIAITMSRRFI